MNFLGLLGFVLLAVVLAALSVAFYWLLRWLFTEMAKADLFVTFRTEGEVKAIMRGEDCIRYVIKIDNHLIDPDDFDIFKASLDNLDPIIKHFWNESEKRLSKAIGFHEKKLAVVTKNSGEDDESFQERIKNEFGQLPARVRSVEAFDEKENVLAESLELKWCVLAKDFHEHLIEQNSPTWLERCFGVVWVGLPPFSVFSYRFRWLKYAQEEVKPGGSPSGRVAMIPRDEPVNSLYFRYPVYGVVIDDVETGISEKLKSEFRGLETIQLKLELVFETETKNPQKTLFRTAGLSSAGDWVSAIAKEIRDRVRPWVGTVDYDHVVNQKAEVTAILDEIRKDVNEIAIPNYGQEIVRLAFVNVDLKDPNLQKAIDDIFKAERERRKAALEAKRDQESAKGKRALAAASYHGRADGMKRIAAIGNGAGTKMRVAESIGEGGIKVLNVGGGGLPALVNLPETMLGELTPPPTIVVPPNVSGGGTS